MHIIYSVYKEYIRSVYKKGFFHLLGANTLLSFFGFISQLFVAWILSPEDIGTIKLLQTYGNIFVTLGGIGYNISILKLCSENRPEGEKLFLYKKGLQYSFIGAIISYIIIIVFSLSKLFSPLNDINIYMLLYGIGILPQIISGVFLSYLQALKKIQSYSRIQIITKSFSIIIVIISTYFLLLKGYIVSIICGYILTNIFLVRHLKAINSGINSVETRNPFRLHNKYSFISLAANFTTILAYSLDIIIINYFITDRTEIGFYSFAVTLLSVFQIFSTTIMQVTNPFFSELSDDFNNWLSKVRKYDGLSLKVSLFITAASLVLMPIFLNNAFHGKYSHSIAYFELLAVAWFFKNQLIIKSSALFGLGKISVNTLVDIIAVPIYSVLIIAGIYYFKMSGAALSVVISSILVFLIQYLIFNNIINNEKNKKNICADIIPDDI
ncbi:MAG: lipopolysaccharide biosynthesis protein [Syntrophomonadaceae bacterium]